MKDITPLEVVTKMKALRLKKELSQIQVAKAMRISQPTLSKMERGSGQPSAIELYRFCEFLRVPIQKFFK